MENELNEARQTYDRLWNEVVPAFEKNDLEFDRHLLDKSQDLRRGLSLVFRPSQEVKDSISTFVRELVDAAPGQYFYRPEEFHITVLAIIPGSELWRQKFQHLAKYQTIIDEALKKHLPFSIRFQGVTASRGAVMIQGFPSDATIAQIRDDLREALRQNGLGGQLDVRYKINTAHITVMRFCEVTADWIRLLELLKANRATDFGETHVANLELILGDWYASTNTVRTLREYPL